jgi:hypothetical protein
MWSEPYLETCCRSALHRLALVGPIGRSAESKDLPCLARLAEMGMAGMRPDGRYEITAAGVHEHARLAALGSGQRRSQEPARAGEHGEDTGAVSG